MATDLRTVTDAALLPPEGTVLLTGADGNAVAVVENGRRHPVLEVDPDRMIASILADDFLVARLEDGLPALVVAERGRPIGLLFAEQIIAVLADGHQPDAGLMGDESLTGRPVIDQLTVVCTTCSASNRYTEVDLGSTLCSGGHLLTVTWA